MSLGLCASAEVELARFKPGDDKYVVTKRRLFYSAAHGWVRRSWYAALSRDRSATSRPCHACWDLDFAFVAGTQARTASLLRYDRARLFVFH